MIDSYKNVEELLLATDPHLPVYCIYPHVYQESTKRFLDGFPGRVLFAVKANNHPGILKQLFAAGVSVVVMGDDGQLGRFNAFVDTVSPPEFVR